MPEQKKPASADMIAVISDLFVVPDIKSRASALQQLFEGERT